MSFTRAEINMHVLYEQHSNSIRSTANVHSLCRMPFLLIKYFNFILSLIKVHLVHEHAMRWWSGVHHMKLL